MAVIDEFATERRRQVDVEGFTPEHDDRHAPGEIASAASGYIGDVVGHLMNGHNYPHASPPPEWPWEPEWWKPKDVRRDLVRAGALLIAEIERMDRAARSPIAPGAADGD
jgi:hypothetical protein